MNKESSSLSDPLAPMVSIVIPVYNAEQYIDECIESLQAQTFDDFEILAVDNGSTDASADILRDFASRDSRISVLSSEGNAGVARNVGMDHASGKYLLFLDADDFFTKNLLRDTIAAAEVHEAQIVLFGGRRFDNSTKTLSKKYEFLNRNFLPKKKVFSACDCGVDFFRITTPAPWSKLFLRSFIEAEGLRFQSLQNSNDVFFVLAALAIADRIVAAEGDYVRYRINLDKSLQSSKSRNPLCFIEALSALGDYLRSSGRYDVLKSTYQLQVLSTVKYNLETSTTGRARLEILDCLIETHLVERDWAPLAEGACGSYVAFLYKFVSAALAQREREKMAAQLIPPSSKLVAPARDGREKVAVSVVMPVYNTADYVRDTVQSVLNQTLTDIEVICVDDGSTDGSLEILLSVAEADPRISVFTQENCGQSSSRNVGINAARGTYLYFMDSDDLLDEQALELCFTEAEANELDLLLFDATVFFESRTLHNSHKSYDTYYTRSKAYDEVMSGAALMVAMAENEDYLPSPCLYLSKTRFVRESGVFFIPGVYHEDNAYTYDLTIRARRASHRKLPLYRRRIRENSTMTGKVAFSHCYGYFACAREMVNTAHSMADELSEELYAGALHVAYEVFVYAQRRYNNLAEGEEGGVLGMTSAERAVFDTLVGKDSSGAIFHEKLAAVEGSKAYKLGRLLTKPYRDAVIMLRERRNQPTIL